MRNNKGFTLIELLITLTIIGLISSVLLPNFSAIQNKAKESNVKSAAHSIQMAIESYALDYGAYPSGGSGDIVSLCQILIDNGDMSKLPINPFTGSIYTGTDVSGKIEYKLDAAAQIYEIEVYGKDNKKNISTLSNS